MVKMLSSAVPFYRLLLSPFHPLLQGFQIHILVLQGMENIWSISCEFGLDIYIVIFGAGRGPDAHYWTLRHHMDRSIQFQSLPAQARYPVATANVYCSGSVNH